jgi:hypothetical protein
MPTATKATHNADVPTEEELELTPPEVIEKHTNGLHLPLLGHVPLARDQVAFCAGLGMLAVIGVIEWPVVAVIGLGHALTRKHHDGTLRELGEALESA